MKKLRESLLVGKELFYKYFSNELSKFKLKKFGNLIIEIDTTDDFKLDNDDIKKAKDVKELQSYLDKILKNKDLDINKAIINLYSKIVNIKLPIIFSAIQIFNDYTDFSNNTKLQFSNLIIAMIYDEDFNKGGISKRKQLRNIAKVVNDLLGHYKNNNIELDDDIKNIFHKVLAKSSVSKIKENKEIIKEKIEKKIIDVNNKELLYKILEKIPNTAKGKELKLAMIISLGTGARASEVLSISKVEPDADGFIVFHIQGKGNKKRPIGFNIELLSKYGLEKYYLNSFSKFSINLNYISHSINIARAKLEEEMNVEINFTFHSLRHSFATAIVKSNSLDLFTLQKRLGHSSIDITKIYVHLDYKDIENSIKRTRNLF